MSGTNRSGLARFEETVRDFWATRPLRPRVGGKVGGVSAAIADRYGIDPILVRVAFILATLYGGAGLVLYLLGWLLFPKEGAPVEGSTEPTREPTSTGLGVVLVLLLFPGIFWLTSSPSILGLILGLGVLYLVHTTYGGRREPAAATGQPSAALGADNTWVYPGTESTSSEQRQTPPAWDPLGAAPFAWDLPEPSEPDEPEPKRPRRLWLTFATLGCAAFSAGLAAAVGATLGVALAIALGVLGVGMIVGSFLGSGRGLIWAAVPVGGLAMLLSVGGDLPADFNEDSGNEEIQPTAVEQVLPHYEKSAGTVELDLQQLKFADNQVLHTGANVSVGSIKVVVPPDVDVTAKCKADLGSVQCLDESADGQSAERSVVDEGHDGFGGGRIVLDLVVGTGDVEVVRG